TLRGLLDATGGVYRISVAPPASGRDRWSFDVTVEFAPDKGGEYTALVAISPWGTRLKECRQLVAPRTAGTPRAFRHFDVGGGRHALSSSHGIARAGPGYGSGARGDRYAERQS